MLLRCFSPLCFVSPTPSFSAGLGPSLIQWPILISLSPQPKITSFSQDSLQHVGKLPHTVHTDTSVNGDGYATCSAQLQAVLWKNIVVKTRHWKMTIMEVLGPLLVLMLLVKEGGRGRERSDLFSFKAIRCHDLIRCHDPIRCNGYPPQKKNRFCNGTTQT
jgi:hypothetical protein